MTIPMTLTVQTNITAPISYVWECWTTPHHIQQWNAASPEWHTPHAVVDLRIGGRFSWRMEAKDGSFGFDFWGTYTTIEQPTLLAYTLGDDRKVKVQFVATGEHTLIIEQFETEQTNSVEMQQMGWQSIVDNFGAYVTRTRPF